MDTPVSAVGDRDEAAELAAAKLELEETQLKLDVVLKSLASAGGAASGGDTGDGSGDGSGGDIDELRLRLVKERKDPLVACCSDLLVDAPRSERFLRALRQAALHLERPEDRDARTAYERAAGAGVESSGVVGEGTARFLPQGTDYHRGAAVVFEQTGAIVRIVAAAKSSTTHVRGGDSEFLVLILRVLERFSDIDERAGYLHDIGATPVLVALMAHPSQRVMMGAGPVLCRIAQASVRARGAVLAAGALERWLSAIPTLAASSPVLARGMLHEFVSWVLDATPLPPLPAPSARRVVPALASMLVDSVDYDMTATLAWGISCMTNDRPEDKALCDSICQLVLDQPRMPETLVALCGHPSLEVVDHTLYVVGNIVLRSDSQTQCLVDAGVVEALRTTVLLPRSSIRKSALWTLSNISAGTPTQVQTVLDSGALRDVVNLVMDWPCVDAPPQPFTPEVLEEAAYVVANLIGSGHAQAVAKWGALRAMAYVLQLPTARPSVQVVAIDNIRHIMDTWEADPDNKSRDGEPSPFACQLEEWGGVDRLEALQLTPNEAVYEAATALLTQHFAVEPAA